MRFLTQLIPKRTVHDKFPKAPDITPTFRTAYLEVITVGVRDLKPYGFQVTLDSDEQKNLGFQVIYFCARRPVSGQEREKIFGGRVPTRVDCQPGPAFFSFRRKLLCQEQLPFSSKP